MLQPLPQVITARGQQNGGNVLGFTANDETVINGLSNTWWADAADDELVESTLRETYLKGQKLAARMGIKANALYLNYAEKWQDPIGGYGEENVEFLRRVSKKYDPKGIFQTAMPGGFKLWTGSGTG